MVVKVYISTVSGNMQVKKHQEYVLSILQSKGIAYEEVDISDTTNEDAKKFMLKHCRALEGQTTPLPPQLFSDDEYCGNFDDFSEANEDEKMDVFLKLAADTTTSQAAVTLTTQNGVTDGQGRGGSVESETLSSEDNVDGMEDADDTPDMDGKFPDN